MIQTSAANTAVFPTSVGVNPMMPKVDLGVNGFPHKRGGEPGRPVGFVENGEFSPQAWG